MRDALDAYSYVASVHITDTTKENPFYHHITAKEVKDIFYKKGWDFYGYTKFCVVRNPFDRMVSLYHHNKKLYYGDDPARSFLVNGLKKIKSSLQPEMNFEKYVKKIKKNDKLAINLEDFVYSNGEKLVDHVLSFESIDEDFSTLAGNVIKGGSVCLPKFNSSKGRRDYRAYYTDELVEMVKSRYHIEINQLGYKF